MKVSLHTRRIYFCVIALLSALILIYLVLNSSPSDKRENFNEKIQFKENKIDEKVKEVRSKNLILSRRFSIKQN